MECYCGLLLTVKAHSKPYIMLSQRVLHKSQIAQTTLQYGLEDILDKVSDVSSKEHVLPKL